MKLCDTCHNETHPEELQTYGHRCGRCYDNERLYVSLSRKEIVKTVNKLNQLRGTKKLIRGIETATGFNITWFEV